MTVVDGQDARGRQAGSQATVTGDEAFRAVAFRFSMETEFRPAPRPRNSPS